MTVLIWRGRGCVYVCGGGLSHGWWYVFPGFIRCSEAVNHFGDTWLCIGDTVSDVSI